MEVELYKPKIKKNFTLPPKPPVQKDKQLPKLQEKNRPVSKIGRLHRIFVSLSD